MVMNRIAVLGLWLVLSAPLVAMAKPEIQLEMRVEKEVVVLESGKEITRRVEVKTIESGNEIIYTIRYRNSGDETATNVVLNNPVPKDTVYVPGSATGSGTEITFSIDGGESYKKPSLLTYEVDTAEGKVGRKATPERYTHIRWVVEAIPAQAEGEVGFRVRVK